MAEPRDVLRRLVEIHDHVLEDTSSDISPDLAIEIAALLLRASVSKAFEEWRVLLGPSLEAARRRRAGGVGRLFRKADDADEDIVLRLEQYADEMLLIAFRIEELLLDIARWSAYQTASREQSTARTLPGMPVQATAVRRSAERVHAVESWIPLLHNAVVISREALGLSPQTHPKKKRITEQRRVKLVTTELLPILRGPASGSRRWWWTCDTQPRLTKWWQGYPHHAPRAECLSASRHELMQATTMRFFWRNPINRMAVGGVLGLVATSWGWWFHRGKLDISKRTAASFLNSSIQWFHEHLWLPARAMAREILFQPTDAEREATRVARVDAQNSLDRMLSEWHRDHPSESSDQHSLEPISRAYERDLRRPWTSLLFGDLSRLALLQVQVLKTETLRLAGDVNDVLIANHFNTQLLATLPALGLVYLLKETGQRGLRWLRDESRSKQKARQELNLMMWEVEHLLIREDDGPALFSILSSSTDLQDEVSSELYAYVGKPSSDAQPTPLPPSASSSHLTMPVPGGSIGYGRPHIGSHTGGSEPSTTRSSSHPLDRSNTGIEDDDAAALIRVLDEEPSLDWKCLGDPAMRGRKIAAGRMLYVLQLMVLHLQHSGVLFEGNQAGLRAALRDVKALFPREGWTAESRRRLVRLLRSAMATNDHAV